MKKFKTQLHKLLKLEFYEDLLVMVLRFFIVRPYYFFKHPIRAFKKISNGAGRIFKKLIKLETYENALIKTLKFLIKRSPLRLVGKKYANHHPYQSAVTSLVTIALIIGGAGYFLFNFYSSSASAWWNDDWLYRKQFTINSSQVTADLENFPILVSVTDGDLASKAQSDGDDIVFTIEQGNKLDHEIESYDATTGTLVAWVKIPNLDGDQDSNFYMYYGNPTTDNMQRPEEVWGDFYDATWHMNDTTTFTDSTRNSYGGTNNGATLNTSGKMANALDFTGSEYIDTEFIHDGNSKTISYWVNYVSTNVYPTIGVYGTNASFYLGLYNNGNHFGGLGNNYTADTAYSINTGQWYHMVLTSDGSTARIYIDGQEKIGTDFSYTYSGTNDLTFAIGARHTSSGFYNQVNGAIDEVRVSDNELSADWIETEFNNQNSPSTFLTFGTEQQGPSPVLYLPLDEGFGTTAHDESSAHNDATITGASWATEDMCKTGMCLQFDGDDYLEIDDDSTLDLQTEMTMEAWVKPTSTTRTNQTIISKTETTDEPTKIYRSVGPSATSAITTGSSNEMTITGTTATFASALPTNVGVGDAIQYDDDDDGDIDSNDSLAFITSRISNVEYQISNASGGTPEPVQGDTDWSLFRAYTSLSNAEAGTENTGIDADLVNFDTWTNGKDISSATGSDEQWNIACYANGTTADSTATTINGWTTAEDNYIRIYTPTDFDEVGTTQRHNGSRDNTKYHLETNTDWSVGIYVNEEYVRLEGLQVSNSSINEGYSLGVQDIDNTNSYVLITETIAYDAGGADGLFISNGTVRVANSMFMNNAEDGVWVTSYSLPNVYVSNVTSVNNGTYGFTVSSYRTLNCSNCYAGGNGTADYYEEADAALNLTTSYSADGSESTPTAAFSTSSGAYFTSVTAGSEDLRIKADSTLIDSGTDLSADADLAFVTDIEGDERNFNDGWDIGADEYHPTKIYRSVGPSATDALEEGTTTSGFTTTTNPMTIVGDTATFSSPLADNIGVGDAIQYDDDDDGDIDANDSIVFIHKRYSNLKYQVRSAQGGLPNEVVQDTDWSLFRAYTSLANAESGDENDGIDDDLEAFESWSSGKNLVTAGEQWNVACYANGTTADTAAVDVNGWTTGANNFIRIFTPMDETEVGTNQRHEGVWDDNKYRLTVTNDRGIDVNEENVRVDGLQLKSLGTNGGEQILIYYPGSTSNPIDMRVSNNIFAGYASNTESWHIGVARVNLGGTGSEVRVWNNILYDFLGGSTCQGIRCRDSNATCYVYNNTVHNSSVGLSRQDSTVYIAKNNILQDVTNGFDGTYDSATTHNVTDEDANDGARGSTWSTGTTTSTSSGNLVDSGATFQSDGVQVGSIAVDTSNTQYTYVTGVTSETQLAVNDDIFVSGENYSVYTNLYGSVDFVDESGDDFHLDTTDTLALEQGADLSNDPYISFINDIDDDTREGSWSIGADEGTPTKIYRSVGPGNTTALATGQGNDLTISGSTATFDQPLPNRIGVGDAIQYDDDGDGDIDANDSIVFIHGRTSATEYTVKTAAGAAPVAVTDDNDWSIFRAYISLANAEGGTENTGIDTNLRNFESWSGGQDLVTNGEQWNIACYGDATDSDSIVINGWTTSEDNYIRIFTPTESSEVGASQRHLGVWNPKYYNISGGIEFRDKHIRVDGIQMQITPLGDYYRGIMMNEGTDYNVFHVSNNIIRGDSTNTYNYHYGITTWAGSSNDLVYIYNNIVYDFQDDSWQGIGITLNSDAQSYVYNNTVQNCQYGFYGSPSASAILKNNIGYNNEVNYSGGSYDETNSTNNISGPSQSNAPGQNPIDNASVSFRNESGDDFRLAMSDTAAKESGLNLYSDSTQPVTTDIEGESRPSPGSSLMDTNSTTDGHEYAFDIGADQISSISHDNYTLGLTKDATIVATAEATFGTYEEQVPANQWTHIAFARDSVDQYLYINGRQEETSAIENLLFANNGKLYIGAQDDNSTNSFQGFLDEIRIYNYARDEREIRADRAAGSSGRAAQRASEGVAATFGGGPDNFMSDGLVGYWKMDETDGTTVLDYSGNNNHGTLTNAQETGTAETASTTTTVVDADNTDLSTEDDAYNGMIVEITGGTCGITTGTTRIISGYTGASKTITVPSAFSAETDGCTFLIDHQVGGKFGNDVQFDGQNDEINFSGPVESGNGSTSVSFWINAPYQDNNIFITNGHYQDNGWYLWAQANAGVISITTNRLGGNETEASNVNLYDESFWTHVTIVFDQDLVTYYKNGAVFGSSDDITHTWVSPSSDFEFGDYYNDNMFFDGSIDEVRIYNRALSANEVKALYDWAPGPVLHLKMDEKVAGDAQTIYDTSGNENHGTTEWGANASGMDCTKPGKYGFGCDFDGVDDYVNAGSDSSLDDLGQMTFSAWIKPDTFNTNDTVFSKNTGGNFAKAIHFRGTNSLRWFIKHATTDMRIYTNDNVISTGVWQHVAVTWNGGSAITDGNVYINGLSVRNDGACTAGVGNIEDDSGGDLIVGDTMGYSDYDFDGLIDDVKIYNYVRTSEQIIEDINAGHPAGGSPVGSPVAYWKFSEGFGDTANDEMGSSNGTLDAGSSGGNTDESEMWDLHGRIGKAIEFDGDDDLVDCGNDSSVQLDSEDWTVSLWAYAHDDEPSSSFSFIEKQDEYLINIKSDDLLYWKTGTSDSGDPTYDLDTNQWYHIVGVYDHNESTPASSMDYLYINGELVDQSSEGDISGTSNPLVIGADSGSYGSYAYDGLLDEVKIYGYAMTAEQVAVEYNSGAGVVVGKDPERDNDGTAVSGAAKEYCVPGSTDPCDPPVGQWDFDEKSGTTVYDTSGNGNDGAISGATWDRGKFGGALSFNGTSDYVSVADAGTSSLDITGDNITINAWIFPRELSPADIGYIVAKGDLGGADPQNYQFYQDHSGSGVLECDFYNGGWNTHTTSANAIAANQWQHVSFVKDAADSIVYVNGIEVLREAETDDMLANDNNLWIGGDSTDQYFNGLIDQVQIFDYSRTPAQIAWDYNRGAPIAEWRMNEGSGTTVHDYSGNGNDGTMTNMDPGTDWVDGHDQKALDFDGSNDYVEISSFDLSSTNAVSVSFWFKTSVVTSDNKMLFEYSTNANLNNAFYINMNGYSPNGCIGLGDHGSFWNIVHTANSYADGNWHHFVGIMDRGLGVDQNSIYIDGKYDTVQDQSYYNDITIDFGGPFDSYIISRAGGSEYLDGLIDDVKIWNYPLTPLQIKEIYNNGSVSFR
jgi:hypothetical protein